MVNMDQGEFDDEWYGNAWRTFISSHPDPWDPMRTFAIEPDHPQVQSWATLRDDIQAMLEKSGGGSYLGGYPQQWARRCLTLDF